MDSRTNLVGARNNLALEEVPSQTFHRWIIISSSITYALNLSLISSPVIFVQIGGSGGYATTAVDRDGTLGKIAIRHGHGIAPPSSPFSPRL